MKLLVLVLALTALAVTDASCANDCSGHGTCNVYSACECYRNWMAADCSERVCYFGHAFVDTPQGDLNADGRTNLATDTYKVVLGSKQSFMKARGGTSFTNWNGVINGRANPTTSLSVNNMVQVGEVKSFFQLTGGGTAVFTGTGSAATLDLVCASDVLTCVGVGAAGSGFEAGDALTVTGGDTAPTGGDQYVVFKVSTVNATGGITAMVQASDASSSFTGCTDKSSGQANGQATTSAQGHNLQAPSLEKGLVITWANGAQAEVASAAIAAANNGVAQGAVALDMITTEDYTTTSEVSSIQGRTSDVVFATTADITLASGTLVIAHNQSNDTVYTVGDTVLDADLRDFCVVASAAANAITCDVNPASLLGNHMKSGTVLGIRKRLPGSLLAAALTTTDMEGLGDGPRHAFESDVVAEYTFASDIYGYTESCNDRQGSDANPINFTIQFEVHPGSTDNAASLETCRNAIAGASGASAPLTDCQVARVKTYWMDSHDGTTERNETIRHTGTSSDGAVDENAAANMVLCSVAPSEYQVQWSNKVEWEAYPADHGIAQGASDNWHATCYQTVEVDCGANGRCEQAGADTEVFAFNLDTGVYDITINTKAECDAQLYMDSGVAKQAVWDASQGCASTDGCEWVATNTGGSAHKTYPNNQTTGICRDSCANMEHQEVVGGYTGANMPANGVAICNNIAGCTAGAHPTKSAWDEAHFYRECANKGVCNRASGQCECFAGYVGEGCTRTQCPNNCSGHGVCKRAIDIDATYLAWDAYKTQSCVCDPGYAGNDCSQRNCPFGDDPITRIGDITEIQSFGIATDGTADAAEKSVRQLTNTHKAASEAWFSLEFTDEQGDKWVTRSVDFLSPNVAEDVESALEALPNRVIEDVEVSFFTGDQSGCTSCVHDATGAVNSGTPRKALGRWVSVTFTHNSGDIPDLGARYDWRYNMPADATETSQHASGTRKLACAGALLSNGYSANEAGNMTIDGIADGTTLFKVGSNLYKADGTSLGVIDDVAAGTVSVGGSGIAVLVADNDELCTDGPVEPVVHASAVATSRITNLPDGSFGRTGFVLSKGLRATPRAVDGNKENAPCSNRGLCDYSSGTCKCFAGYTDFDCSVQNALSMG